MPCPRVSSLSVHVAISRLGQTLVRFHLVFESNEHFLECIRCVPVAKHVELLLHSTVVLVHAWQINFRVKLYDWWLGWVVLTAGDGQHVDSIVVVRVWWADDCSVPVGEGFVVT